VRPEDPANATTGHPKLVMTSGCTKPSGAPTVGV
jgi:hypothetical protein